MSSEQFCNCACCKRSAMAGTGMCDVCKDAGCHRDAGIWRRGPTCRVVSKVARKTMPDPRNTGRQQGIVGTVQCRWCLRQFAVWTKTKSGKKRSWRQPVRMHVRLRHRWEARGVADVAEMVKDSKEER